MRRRYPARPAQRDVRNTLEWLGGGVNIEQPKPRTRGPQPEGAVNKVIIQTAREFGSKLWRNRRGMLPLPNGGMLPFGLGPAGFPDDCGYTPIVITPEMVGRKVAVFTAFEAKTDEGVLASHQEAVLNELRDDGCIVGVATCGEDVRDGFRRWGR